MNNWSETLKKFLAEKGFDQVREVVIEQGPDSTGDESLFVWLLLDDKVPDKKLDWEQIEPMVTQARQQMRELEPQLYPYIRVRRVREWRELREMATA